MPGQGGRPRGAESRRRAQEMLRRIAEGESPKDAARNAKVKPERVLTLLGDDAFFAAYQAVRSGDIGATAAAVYLDQPDVLEAEAA